MNVLKKINKLRLEKGWSVYRLSVESGVPQSTITNMFNRETLPSIATLESLCEALGITMSDFFKEDVPQDAEMEVDFINLFQSLPAKSQQAVLNLMKDLL